MKKRRKDGDSWNISKWCSKRSSKAQVTVFIIVAIAIVVGIGLFFLFRDNIIKVGVPEELKSVYSYYLSCIESETINGAMILGQQGGYIKHPEFSPGSEYMPFSNQLNFLGTPVPYWYYISGNGIKKEQVPSKAKMESELNDFLEERVRGCDFSSFEEKGFNISLDNRKVNVDSSIKDNSVEVKVEQSLNINYGDVSWSGGSHSVDVKSSLGRFYNLAEKIYLENKQTMFLENYGVDILRLYAPVDGVEISCASKVWFVEEIRENLINALEANIPHIKIKGDYYKLSKEKNKYFVNDIGENVNANINFMYSRNWPMKMEIWPSEDNVLRADPIGLQEGLGMLGFCYVPYHFVYDFAYPILIQIYNGEEMFQFPVVVSIDKNKAREAVDAEGLPDVVPELCEHKNSKISVYTYNTSLESVEAEISFKCFDTTCSIGRTEKINGSSDAVLIRNFPQCVNGYIIAGAEGYETKKQLTSTVNEANVIIVLDRKYKLELEVQKEGSGIETRGDRAVVIFIKNNKSKTLSYPEQKEVELTEGQYEIKVYVYSDSSINLRGESYEKCVDVPKSGFLGIFGFSEEKCFTMDIPDQIISFAVSGGGKQNYYITESELQESDKLVINTRSFETPNELVDLQTNYNNVEINGLDVRFEQIDNVI